MDVIKVKCKSQTIPISLARFLNDHSLVLTQEELDIREVLQFLYDENTKDPPLFEKFPDWRKDKPLTINCTASTQDNNSAEFDYTRNVINFQYKPSKLALVGKLAHELKHAQLCTKELYERQYGAKRGDSLERQQLIFLDESEAYVLGNYARVLFLKKNGMLDQEWTTKRMMESGAWDIGSPIMLPKMLESVKTEMSETHKNYKKLEQEIIPLMLDKLYKTNYHDEVRNPISETDKGLAIIPKDFELEKVYAQHLLQTKLQNIPKDKLLVQHYLVAQEQNRTKVLQQILSQENENGDGLLSTSEYDMLRRFSQQFEDEKGMIALLKKRNRDGKPWLPLDIKMEAVSFFMIENPEKEVGKILKEFQKDPAVFNEGELSVVLQDDRFATPQIQDALKNSTNQGKGNNSGEIKEKFSKLSKDGKNLVQKNNSKTTFSLAQQAVLNSKKPQH